MKTNLISKSTITEFAKKHVNSKLAFEQWLKKVKETDWGNLIEIKRTFNSVDFLGKSSNRIVFDIGGNNFRMICMYKFRKTRIDLFVCWIGTHADYTKLCKEGKQYDIWDN